MFSSTVQPLYADVGPSYVATIDSSCSYVYARFGISVLIQARISIKMWFIINERMLQTYLSLVSTCGSTITLRYI